MSKNNESIINKKRKSNKELRMLYLSKRGKNTPEMSQGELIDELYRGMKFKRRL